MFLIENQKNFFFSIQNKAGKKLLKENAVIVFFN
jgi:hypothetical protein